MKNFVVWFELPVKDLARAVKFYSQVFSIELQIQDMGAKKRAIFPFENDSASGALVETRENVPMDKGTLVYLNGGDDLALFLKRVEAAGGRVIQEKTSIGEYGFIAIFKDTEGNNVGLWSMK